MSGFDVSSLWWRVGQESFLFGKIRHDLPGYITKLDDKGNILLRWVDANRCVPGNFIAPHGICVDSQGSIYVAEVTYSFGVRQGLVPEEAYRTHTFQKFIREAIG